MKLVLDSEKSLVRVRTFAEGFLAKLAHDLELVCRDLRGDAERSSEQRGSARVEVAVSGIEIGGILKNGYVDANGLSGFERSEAISKMRKDVFQANASSAIVRASATAEGTTARYAFAFPNGREVSRDGAFTIVEESDAMLRVSGSVSLSLQAIGSATVKGPMNAFRVKDAIEVLFELMFTPAG